VDVAVQVMEFLGFTVQLEHHQIPHGEEPDHLFVAHNRQMAALVLIHTLQSFFQRATFADGGEIGGHDRAHRSRFRVQAADDDASHQIALAEYTPKLVVFKNQNGPNPEFVHAPGDIGYGLIRLNAEKISIVENILDSDHTCPSWKPIVKYHKNHTRDMGEA